jgi:PIN domain nuclease of toxin-antitoxin system
LGGGHQGGLGKYALVGSLDAYFADAIRLYGLRVLQITLQRAQAVAVLPHHHRDPFGRLMIAQAMVEGLTLVSGDSEWDKYGASVVW